LALIGFFGFYLMRSGSSDPLAIDPRTDGFCVDPELGRPPAQASRFGKTGSTELAQTLAMDPRQKAPYGFAPFEFDLGQERLESGTPCSNPFMLGFVGCTDSAPAVKGSWGDFEGPVDLG
jgi:hypothetical protein